MLRRPPISTRTYTLFPYTTLLMWGRRPLPGRSDSNHDRSRPSRSAAEHTHARSCLAGNQWRGGRVPAVRCLGIAALFGFEVALARSLGVTGYGAFSFGLALAGLASRLGPLGWLSPSTRLVSSYVSLGKDGLLKGSLLVAHAATAVGLAAALPLLLVPSPTSEARRVGHESASSCQSRGSTY